MILTDEERAELVGNVANIGDGLRIARAIESAVLRKLRERPADAWITDRGDIVRPGTPDAEWSSWTPLHIIPEVNE